MTEPVDHGHLPDGTAVTDEMLDRWSAEAEVGYDVDVVKRRRVGRPPLGVGASTVESVRLDADLKRDLLLQAARDGVSVSELIRTALREYVHAH